MMRRELQFILITCIVYVGLTPVRPHNQTADQTVTGKGNEKGEIRENFQNLFNSIAKKETKKSENYHGVLKQEVVKEQQAFDTMKDELQTARNRNIYKKMNFYKKSKIDANVIAIKRETNENKASTTNVLDAQPINDSWLEEANFESMLAQQPELLRARMQELYKENQSLKKTGQASEDTKSDSPAQVKLMDTVAIKLRTFENWELSMFGRVLQRDQRINIMRMFLKRLVKDDDWAFEMSGKFRTIWGILPSSNNSQISEVARGYADEISFLGGCIFKWCEYQTLEVSSVNTKYIDRVIDAGLIPKAEPPNGTVCVGYAKWRATYIPAHTTAHPSRERTLYFHPESLKGQEKEAIKKEFKSVPTEKVEETRKKKKKKVKDADQEYFMDSGEDVVEEDPNTVDYFTRDPSFYRLPNWQ